MVGRRIGDNSWSLYCSRGYAEAHGAPRRRSELPGHSIIGGGGEGVERHFGEWLTTNGLSDAVEMRYGSVPGLLAAIRAGSGLSVLPAFVADRVPDLVRCLPPVESERSSLWLVTHERLRREPRIRTVVDFLAERLGGLARATGPATS